MLDDCRSTELEFEEGGIGEVEELDVAWLAMGEFRTKVT